MRALPALITLVAITACGGATHGSVTRGALTIHTFTRDSTNVFVVVQGAGALMFDSGYERNAAALEADLREAGIDPARLRAIVISHGHADHAGGAKHFHDRFKVPVVVGEADQGMYVTGKHDQPLCSTGLMASLRHDTDANATYSGSQPDLVLAAPIDLEPLTGIEGRLAPLPGHTKGSLVAVTGDVALVGDLLRGSLVGAAATRHLYMCDLEGNDRDIGTLLRDLAPKAAMVFTGHFGPVSRESVLESFPVR